MPNLNEHIAQAQHNHSFWSSSDLSSNQFLDWVVTVIFYEGVHLVEAFLSSRGEHPTRHSHRLAAMKRHNKEMGPVIADLETLKVESENARYRCYKHQPNDVTNDLIPLINKIESHVQNVLKGSSSTQP